MRHHLLTLHPIFIPGTFLLASYWLIWGVTPHSAEGLVAALMVTGGATVLAVWLLLRQFLATLIIGAQGYEEGKKAQDYKLEEIRRDMSEVRRIPAIRRAIMLQRELESRAEIGGEPTPTAEKMPEFKP
jgi:hypothetical protein